MNDYFTFEWLHIFVQKVVDSGYKNEHTNKDKIKIKLFLFFL